MYININKNRKLELIGDVTNDENKEYWVMVRVSPVGLEAPSSQTENATQKVAVCDGLARIIPDEIAKIIYDRRETETITS